MARVAEHRKSSCKEPNHENDQMKPPKALEMGSEFSFECRLGLVKTRDDRFLVS